MISKIKAIDWKSVTWICLLCGKKYGTIVPRMATWHLDRCDVCGNERAVTEPRDFFIGKTIE